MRKDQTGRVRGLGQDQRTRRAGLFRADKWGSSRPGSGHQMVGGRGSNYTPLYRQPITAWPNLQHGYSAAPEPLAARCLGARLFWEYIVLTRAKPKTWLTKKRTYKGHLLLHFFCESFFQDGFQFSTGAGYVHFFKDLVLCRRPCGQREAVSVTRRGTRELSLFIRGQTYP